MIMVWEWSRGGSFVRASRLPLVDCELARILIWAPQIEKSSGKTGGSMTVRGWRGRRERRLKESKGRTSFWVRPLLKDTHDCISFVTWPPDLIWPEWPDGLDLRPAISEGSGQGEAVGGHVTPFSSWLLPINFSGISETLKPCFRNSTYGRDGNQV